MKDDMLVNIFEQFDLHNYPIMGVINQQRIIASNDSSLVQHHFEHDLSKIRQNQGITMINDYLVKSLSHHHTHPYVVFIKSTDARALELLQLLSRIMSPILSFLHEQMDIKTFIQYRLKGKELTSSIDDYLVRFQLKPSNQLVVIILVLDQSQPSLQHQLEEQLNVSLYVEHDTQNQYLAVFDLNQPLQQDLLNQLSNEPLEHYILAKSHLHSYATLDRAFNEVKDAIRIHEMFHLNQRLIECEHLGIYDMIYHMSENELSKRVTEDQRARLALLDPEILDTVHVFLYNNLNITDTAKHLFIHRNTLLYRLNRLKDMMHIDVRKFDDAMWFLILILTNYRLQN